MRNAGQVFQARVYPVQKGTGCVDGEWRDLGISFTETWLRGMRQWPDPALKISQPLFEDLNVNAAVVRVKVGVWKLLVVGQSRTAMEEGLVQAGPGVEAGKRKKAGEMRRVTMVKVEREE